MEESDIKKIVFRPQFFSLSDIKELAKDAATWQQLATIFGNRLLTKMLNSSCEVYIPQGGLYGTDQPSNLVVFWGLPQSGRTSAILSILSQKGFSINLTPNQDGNLDKCINTIRSLFKSQDATYIPCYSKDDISEIYHAKYKRWLLGRSYNISFFKPQNDFNNYEVLSILKGHPEQTHVLCIDCDKNNLDLAYLKHQIEHHEKVLNYLEKQGILQKSNAIYVLLTKSDLMNVPDIYEENAAQTFVTSGMPEFWHRIKEECYKKDIYNTQPVAFSIGNFILKDFTRMDADYAKIFLEESIIPKCQPNQNIIEKILSKGKIKYTPFFFAALFLVVLYGIIHAFSAIVPPPEQKVAAFNYAEFFMKQEKQLTTLSFEQAASTYYSLRADLNEEHSLRLVKGEKVLPDSIYHPCESALTNDFSAILLKELNRLFSSKRWTADKNLLRKRDHQIMDLLNRPSLKASVIRDYHTYIYHYFNSITPLLNRSNKCNTVSEARALTLQAARWKKHPYNKDILLNRKLSDVKSKAYNSCADNYRRIANNRIIKYNNKVNEIKKGSDWYSTSLQLNNVSREFQKENQSLVNQISLLISDLKSANDNRLVTTRKSMEQTQAALVSIYK